MERFVIVNDFDRPYRDNVAEWVDGFGYCYMSRLRSKGRKRFDGMMPSKPTSLSTFGFEVSVRRGLAVFNRKSVGTATYVDGRPRSWDGPIDDSFALPLVQGVRRRGSVHRKVVA